MSPTMRTDKCPITGRGQSSTPVSHHPPCILLADPMTPHPEIQFPRVSIGPLSCSYARLPAHFFVRLMPVPVAEPRLIRVNRPLAAELGLDLGSLDSDALAAIFSGNVIPEGAEPIAMAYAGHQFGQFVSQLGDGRAILLAEARDLAPWRANSGIELADRESMTSVF